MRTRSVVRTAPLVSGLRTAGGPDGLAAGKPYEHWLPIFDNADDPATMRG